MTFLFFPLFSLSARFSGQRWFVPGTTDLTARPNAGTDGIQVKIRLSFNVLFR